MLDLKQFKPDDIMFFVDPVEKDIQGAKEWAEYNAIAGPAFTGYYEGVPVGAAGFRYRANGVAEPWFILDKKATVLKKSVFKSVRSMLKILINRYKPTRLITLSKIGFPESQRLLEHLGFKQIRKTPDRAHYYYRMEVN